MMQPSQEIRHRDEFALLCSWRNLWRAVEVGVDRGEFAIKFLERWHHRGELYLGVDPYVAYDDMRWNREADKAAAMIRFERHARRAKLIVGQSVSIAEHLRQEGPKNWYAGQYGFVYLDGDHSFRGVTDDLNAWWSLLSPEGIMAGHDWSTTGPDRHPDVKNAVTVFADKNGLNVYHTVDDDPSSWYMYKSGSVPGPEWRRC